MMILAPNRFDGWGARRRTQQPGRGQKRYRLRHLACAKGGKHPDAKPLKGFGGAGVIEITENFDGNTWRAVYTVQIADAVWVLHFFQKKSKKGIATPKSELDLIEQRLKDAIAQAKRERAKRGH